MPETPKYDVSRFKIDYILYNLLIQRLKSWWGSVRVMREVQSLEALFGGQADNVGAAAPVAEPFLSIAEAARALRISPTTLRRYIRDYSAHIDAVRDSRKLMVAVSSIPALAQIRDLRARKLQKPEIDNILAALPGEISLSGLPATHCSRGSSRSWLSLVHLPPPSAGRGQKDADFGVATPRKQRVAGGGAGFRAASGMSGRGPSPRVLAGPTGGHDHPTHILRLRSTWQRGGRRPPRR